MSDSVFTGGAEPSLPASAPVPIKRSAGRPPHDDDPRTTRYLILTMRQQAIIRGNGWRDRVLARYRVDRIEAIPRQGLLNILTACEAPDVLLPGGWAVMRWAERESPCAWPSEDLRDAINYGTLANEVQMRAILDFCDVPGNRELTYDMSLGILAAITTLNTLNALKAIEVEAALETAAT
jgi:hypothetical protein